MAHPVDLLVNLGFFFDVGVGAGHVGFGLVVVVEADEILDGVVGEKRLHLAIKLRGEGFVGGKDDGGALGGLDHLGHGEGFTGARRAKQYLILFTVLDALHQFLDRRGLVTSGFEFRMHDDTLAALELGAGDFVWHCVFDEH